MTAVFIRREDDPKGAYLADVPFDKLDTVIPTLRAWGIEGEDPEMSAQFALGGAGAFFEVVIHEDDD